MRREEKERVLSCVCGTWCDVCGSYKCDEMKSQKGGLEMKEAKRKKKERKNNSERAYVDKEK